MSVYDKNLTKIVFSRTTEPIVYSNCYKVYINNDPVLNMTYLRARSKVHLGLYDKNLKNFLSPEPLGQLPIATATKFI